MAVGVSSLAELHPIAGLRLGTACAGIKTPDRPDLVIMELCGEATVAGVFTRNAFCAAPVQIAKQHLLTMTPSYFLINTGNANAGTGTQGLADALATCLALAEHMSVTPESILPFSTGVIGEALPVVKIVDTLPQAAMQLTEDGWAKAAQGIMTTDTRPKGASFQFDFEGHTITVTGIAKGAGMIKPNMATMLAYIATDAPVQSQLVDTMIQVAVNQSFNRITIDGDTSTNDACMLVATGRACVDVVKSKSHPLYDLLLEAITTVCIELAQGLVRDGEGASKFVTVVVKGGNTQSECLKVAYTVAESPLVKTALFASDPNWGRILAAIGRADIDELDVEKVNIYLNETLIAHNGGRSKTYTEEQGAALMNEEEINIVIDLARGEEHVSIWTSDLSYDYVRINAEYRT